MKGEAGHRTSTPTGSKTPLFAFCCPRGASPPRPVGTPVTSKWIASTEGRPAINADDLTVDPGTVGGEQEGDHRGDVLGFTQSRRPGATALARISSRPHRDATWRTMALIPLLATA